MYAGNFPRPFSLSRATAASIVRGPPSGSLGMSTGVSGHPLGSPHLLSSADASASSRTQSARSRA